MATDRILAYATQSTDSSPSNSQFNLSVNDRTPRTTQTHHLGNCSIRENSQHSSDSSLPADSSLPRSAYGGIIARPTTAEAQGDPYAPGSFSLHVTQSSSHRTQDSLDEGCSSRKPTRSPSFDTRPGLPEPYSQEAIAESSNAPRNGAPSAPSHADDNLSPVPTHSVTTSITPRPFSSLRPLHALSTLHNAASQSPSPPLPPPNQLRLTPSDTSFRSQSEGSQASEYDVPASQRPDYQRERTPEEELIPTQLNDIEDLVATQVADEPMVPTQLEPHTPSNHHSHVLRGSANPHAISVPETLTQLFRGTLTRETAGNRRSDNAASPEDDLYATSTVVEPQPHLPLNTSLSYSSNPNIPHQPDEGPQLEHARPAPSLDAEMRIPGIDDDIEDNPVVCVDTGVDQDRVLAEEISATTPQKRKGKGRARSVATKRRKTETKHTAVEGTEASTSGSSNESTDPTVVFAPFNGWYYRAIVTYYEAGSPQCCAAFSDGATGAVKTESIYQYILIDGDFVQAYGTGGRSKGEVIDCSEWSSKESVTLREKDGSSVKLAGDKLRLASRWVNNNWAARRYQFDQQIENKVERNRSLVPMKPKSRRSQSGKLNGVGIVISLVREDKDKKKKYRAELEERGASVYDDWTEVYEIGKGPQSDNTESEERFPGGADNFKYIATDAHQLFLLADKESTTVKYLFALACGIPCVSVAILHDKQGFESWTKHLLPAGTSNHLQSRLTQRVLFEWPASRLHVPNDSPLSLKMFRGKQVVLRARIHNDVLDSITNILWALGSAKAHILSGDISKSKLRGYDFIITYDTDAKVDDWSSAKVLTFQDLKEIIISGIEPF